MKKKNNPDKETSSEEVSEEVSIYKENPYTEAEVSGFPPFASLTQGSPLLFYSKRYDQEGSGQSKEQSVKDIIDAYRKISPLAQKYFDILINIIGDTRNKEDSFEGIVFESKPLVKADGDGYDRWEFYNQGNQQISLCTAHKILHKYKEDGPKELPIFSEKDCISNLIHELTHGIDDLENEFASGAAVQKLYSSKDLINNLKQQMNLAANIISPSGTLEDSYLKGFYKKSSFINQEHTDDVDTALLEFLTFHNEIIFDKLKSSDTPEEFSKKYSTHLESFAKFTPGTEEDKKAALRLVHNASEEFLNLVINHNTIDPALKQALGTIKVNISAAIEATISVNSILTEPVPKITRLPKEVTVQTKADYGNDQGLYSDSSSGAPSNMSESSSDSTEESTGQAGRKIILKREKTIEIESEHKPLINRQYIQEQKTQEPTHTSKIVLKRTKTTEIESKSPMKKQKLGSPEVEIEDGQDNKIESDISSSTPSKKQESLLKIASDHGVKRSRETSTDSSVKRQRIEDIPVDVVNQAKTIGDKLKPVISDKKESPPLIDNEIPKIIKNPSDPKTQEKRTPDSFVARLAKDQQNQNKEQDSPSK